MGFLNPLFFLGALTLAVPILVHLVRKDKSDIVRFSSLMFLLRIPRKTVRQQMLRNLMLMVLRLLLLALLIGAFARPYFVQSTAADVIDEDSRGLVVMLDNSYSMNYGTNFGRMQAEANERIDSLTPSDRAVLISFSDRATVLGTQTNDQAELKAMVASVEPTSNRTAYYDAFAMADRVLAQFEGLSRELVVISDFQRNGWNRSSREPVIDSDVQTEMVDLGVENPDNVGFESVNVDATVFSRTYEGQLLARVNNHALASSATVTVSLDINDRTVESREVSIAAESSELVEFTGFELDLGYSQGRVRIEDEDALMDDNEFVFSILRRDRLPLLVIDAGRTDQSRFIRDAFASAPDLPFEVGIKSYNDVTAAELEDYEVVIINDVPRFSDAIGSQLDVLRAQGQGQLVFLGDYAESDWWNGYAALPVVINGTVFTNDRNRPFYSITTYERSHPIFEALEQRSRVTLNTAQFLAFTDIEAKEGALVMAKFEDGSHAIVESPESDSGLIVMGSPVDNTWSDWPLKPSFLQVLHQTVRYLARYQDSRASYQLGEAVNVPSSQDGVAAITPEGDRINLGAGETTGPRFFTPEEVGFYEVRVGPETSYVAVNVASAESQLGQIPPDDLLASVQRFEGEARRGALLAESEADDQAQRQNWWWYLFLIALMAGVGELYLGNRVTQANKEAPPVVSRQAAQ